jgi:hypothetical protein
MNMIDAVCSTGMCGGCSSCKRKNEPYKKECKHEWLTFSKHTTMILDGTSFPNRYEYIEKVYCKFCLKIKSI